MNDRLVETIATASRVGPASFGDQEWLVVWNLGSSTAMTFIAMFFAVDLLRRLWSNRHRDGWDHPVTLFRAVLLLFSLGIFFRKGVAAAVLWLWNPVQPSGTATWLYLQRLIDPLADILQLVAMSLSVVAVSAMVEQLRKRPWRIPIWEEAAQLKGYATVALLAFVVAFFVVKLR